MKKETEIEINQSVREFTSLWNESLDNRFEAAKIYYD